MKNKIKSAIDGAIQFRKELGLSPQTFYNHLDKNNWIVNINLVQQWQRNMSRCHYKDVLAHLLRKHGSEVSEYNDDDIDPKEKKSALNEIKEVKKRLGRKEVDAFGDAPIVEGHERIELKRKRDRGNITEEEQVILRKSRIVAKLDTSHSREQVDLSAKK